MYNLVNAVISLVTLFAFLGIPLTCKLLGRRILCQESLTGGADHIHLGGDNYNY